MGTFRVNMILKTFNKAQACTGRWKDLIDVKDSSFVFPSHKEGGTVSILHLIASQ